MELRISIVIYFNFFNDLWHAHLTGFCFSWFYYVITNVIKIPSFLHWTLEACMRPKRLCFCLDIFFWMWWCYSFLCSNGKIFAGPAVSFLIRALRLSYRLIYQIFVFIFLFIVLGLGLNYFSLPACLVLWIVCLFFCISCMCQGCGFVLVMILTECGLFVLSSF